MLGAKIPRPSHRSGRATNHWEKLRFQHFDLGLAESQGIDIVLGSGRDCCVFWLIQKMQRGKFTWIGSGFVLFFQENSLSDAVWRTGTRK
ncbi:MAG TPA: hypothetical protein DD473_21005 [Planctomycetaceae bacterium]|nr:hypothetical protein [Planctomycetaceae bacterium]